MSRRDPGVPYCVHFAKRRHVGQIDRRAQKPGLIASRSCQVAIDDREHLLRLFRHAFSRRVVGYDAGEIDGIAVDEAWLMRGPVSKRWMVILLLRLDVA